MTDILNRIWKVLPGVLGIMQQMLPIAREFSILSMRLLAIVYPHIETKIPTVKKLFDSAEKWFEQVKNFFLP